MWCCGVAPQKIMTAAIRVFVASLFLFVPGVVGDLLAQANTGALPSQPPVSQVQPKERQRFWLAPDKATPNGTRYETFRSRIAGQDTSFLLSLPASYDASPNKRFPVIFYLHGSGVGQSSGALSFLPRMQSLMVKGQVPESIVVFANGMDDLYYMDSKDGKYPTESVIVKELVPYIDRTFRTIAKRDCRAVAGYSMGGYGAAHLGFKYPETFGVVASSSGGTMTWETLSELPMGARILPLVYGSDREYFEANNPSTLARRNAGQLRHTSVLLTVGSGEVFNVNGTIVDQPRATRELHELLDSLSIPNTFIVEPGGHGKEFFEKASDAPFLFFHEAFGHCVSPERGTAAAAER